VNEILEKHQIEDDLYVYLQRNSKVWLARFKIDGKWMSRTTKQRDKAKAINSAIKVKAECDIKFEHGIAIQTKAFKEVAELAIAEMDNVPEDVKGYVSLADYKSILRRYHIRFFDRTHITSIGYEKLAEFNRWRASQLGRTPAQSTLKTHNAALQRVFDEAVNRKWLLPSKVPRLSSTSGVVTSRREHFTDSEIERIENAFPNWIAASRKGITRDIRRLLYYYFFVALHTGLRPGTEMDELLWSDLKIRDDADPPMVLITVRKGKTTLHTGPRQVVGHADVMEIILDMQEWSLDGMDSEEGVPDDFDPLVFRLPDGTTTRELGRSFTALMKLLKLDTGSGGKRTLYSLRHTYITQRLNERVDAELIAKQCGTSAAMIAIHYNHIITEMRANELIGTSNVALTRMLKLYAGRDTTST